MSLIRALLGCLTCDMSCRRQYFSLIPLSFHFLRCKPNPLCWFWCHACLHIHRWSWLYQFVTCQCDLFHFRLGYRLSSPQIISHPLLVVLSSGFNLCAIVAIAMLLLVIMIIWFYFLCTRVISMWMTNWANAYADDAYPEHIQVQMKLLLFFYR